MNRIGPKRINFKENFYDIIKESFLLYLKTLSLFICSFILLIFSLNVLISGFCHEKLTLSFVFTSIIFPEIFIFFIPFFFGFCYLNDKSQPILPEPLKFRNITNNVLKNKFIWGYFIYRLIFSSMDFYFFSNVPLSGEVKIESLETNSIFLSTCYLGSIMLSSFLSFITLFVSFMVFSININFSSFIFLLNETFSIYKTKLIFTIFILILLSHFISSFFNNIPYLYPFLLPMILSVSYVIIKRIYFDTYPPKQKEKVVKNIVAYN